MPLKSLAKIELIMQPPLVTIITPIYGVEKYIERCARSLFEQTYNNIEYIFVNDCTKDASIEILQSVIDQYSNRKKQIQIVNHENNRGLGAARNSGIEVSRGDYIMHVDSDDYIDLDTVSLLVESAQSAGSDIAICGYKRVYQNLTVNCTPNKIYDIVAYRQKVISGDASHTVWGKLIKATLYKDYNIRAIEGLHQGEDYAVYPKLAHVAKTVSYIDSCCYNYVMRNSLTLLKVTNIRDTADSIEEVKAFLVEKGDYSIYCDYIEQYIQKMKCWLVNTWILSDYNNKEIAEKLNVFFPKCKTCNQIRLDMKITLYLFEHGYYTSLRMVAIFRCYLQALFNKSGKQA